MDILGNLFNIGEINIGFEEQNVLPGLGAMSNKPRVLEKPAAGPEQVPLLKGLSEEKNGVITMYGQNILGANLDNIFSFTYYLPEGSQFVGSTYYYGLQAYIQLAHGEIKVEGVSFPHSCGVIIYTNKYTFPKLLEVFSFERYPNLSIALVNWPYFTDETGNVNNTVMRTLRFHAVEHFQTKNVHIRDADTLFVNKIKEMNNSNYNEKPKTAEQKEAAMKAFHDLVYTWEVYYFATIPRIENRGKQIIFGSATGYSPDYHKNLPYPIAFQFPFLVGKTGHISDPLIPDKFLYVKSEFIPWSIQEKINATYGNIARSYTANEKNLKYNKDPAIRKQILNIRKKRAAYHYLSDNFKAYNKELKAIADKVRNSMMKSVPEELLIPIPFSLDEYMIKAFIGVFAGFVSVLKNRKGIEDFWKLCVEYLLSRYKMVRNVLTHKLIVSNEVLGSYSFGKDERMLMYGVAPKFLDKIFAYPIEYSINPTNIYRSAFYEPKVYFKNTVEKEFDMASRDAKVSNRFKDGIEMYSELLRKFYEKYPTEKDFLNAVDKNLSEKVVPLNRLKAHKTTTSRRPVNPYEYPQKVVRGGKTRKRRNSRKN